MRKTGAPPEFFLRGGHMGTNPEIAVVAHWKQNFQVYDAFVKYMLLKNMQKWVKEKNCMAS